MSLVKNLKKKSQKLPASALLSAILVLTTCIVFVQFYMRYFLDNMENNLMLLNYFL